MPAFNGLQQVINYMIPAVGTPRGYFWSGVLTGSPVTIDFRNVSGGGIDGQVFRPSGVFIDNTQGTGPVTIVVNEIAYQMICLAGELLNLQFPAPVECTVSFIGDGQTTIAFVDFPVLPYRNVASSAGAALWGAIAGTLSDQSDLQSALDAKLTIPVGSEGEVLTYISGTWQSAALPTIDATDLISRAGATRFIAIGTFNDSDDAGGSGSRNVLSTDADGRGRASAALTIASMASITEYTMYGELHMTSLPTGTVDFMRFEGNTTGDAYIYLQVTPTGALSTPRDKFFGSVATSAAGVIVAGTHHKVVVFYDASVSGGAIKVYVDGALVINSTTTSSWSTEATQNYQIGKSTTSLNGSLTWFSNFGVWSVALSDADAIALSTNGDPTAYDTGNLRMFWPLDETSGNALPDIGTGNLLLGNSAAWGTATVFTPAAVGDAVRVGSAGTNLFTGHNNEIAVLLTTGWVFLAQQTGRQCYDQGTNAETLWNGSAWV